MNQVQEPANAAHGDVWPSSTVTSHSTLPQAESSGGGGRQFAKNVFANWAGQFVTVVSGFFLPRLISDTLGPEELGIWDFGWSLRSIIAISSLDMGSSTAHFVSRHRALDQWDELNRVLSATLGLLLMTAAVATGLTAVLVYYTPRMSTMDGTSESLILGAQWMVGGMGLSAAVQMIAVIYVGVLAGSHRFDLFNLVEIIADIGIVAAILIVLFAGYGLRAMAVCVFVRTVFDLVFKAAISHRLYPRLRIRPRWTDWQVMRHIIGFGGKTMAHTFAVIVFNQAAAAILMAYQGAVAVAMFSRPRALIRFATRFLMGYARVLAPKANELHQQGRKQELAELYINGTRSMLFLALPIIAGLFILGRPILHAWMGEAYADPTVLTILVVGFTPYFVQLITWHVLLGLGAHGLPSIADFVGSLVSVGLLILLVGYWNWGLVGAAISLALPVALVNTVVYPLAGCRVIELTFLRYVSKSLPGPMLAIIPFVGVLMACKTWLADRPVVCLLTGAVAGGLVLLPVYWHMALPPNVKRKLILRFFPRRTA